MTDPRPSTPVPDPVVAHLNRARAEIKRICHFATGNERPRLALMPGVALATADALLAIVVAVEELARQVRK